MIEFYQSFLFEIQLNMDFIRSKTQSQSISTYRRSASFWWHQFWASTHEQPKLLWFRLQYGECTSGSTRSRSKQPVFRSNGQCRHDVRLIACKSRQGYCKQRGEIQCLRDTQKYADPVKKLSLAILYFSFVMWN